MNILVVGGGGREHAIAHAIRKNNEVKRVYALPGNAGISEEAVCEPISAVDIDGIARFAKTHAIDFAVVAQDDPLALGAVDRLHELGVKCFGPDKRAAQIESSKLFAKALMKKYAIPTAAYVAFDAPASAFEYALSAKYPLVIKADGLALGKGVMIVNNAPEAEAAIRAMMIDRRFGESGSKIVIEEYLTGPEVSVLAFTDGHTIVPMVSSMDHKRALDGDMGPNTGGMGAIAPNPLYTREIADECMKTIFQPTMRAMRAEGRPFKGCLYFGLMLTDDGPKVIEYNCRFGDPEAQVVLPLLKTDLLTIMRAVEDERLGDISVEFEDANACCVMIASGGYPGEYAKGYAIDFGRAREMAEVYHSGTKLGADGAILTNGGRVLGVVAKADALESAVRAAYKAAGEISFEGAYMRYDIGARAMRAMSST